MRRIKKKKKKKKENNISTMKTYQMPNKSVSKCHFQTKTCKMI